MKIEKIDIHSSLHPKLQDFIEKHQLFFNSSLWLKNYPGKQIVQCVILNNNNDIIGCFIYYEFKKLVFKFIISPPFSPHSALFYINPSESVVGKNSFDKELMQSLAEYFDGLGVSFININFPENIVDTQPFIWKGFISNNRYSYLLDLSKTIDELWNNLSSEKRKSINRAVKDNLLIKEISDPDQLYSLVIKSLERNNMTKNSSIIKKILFSLSSEKKSFAFVAYNNNIPVGATFCLVAGTKAVYLFGGFDSENKHHGAGVSCMWQSILKAKELNLSYFDFEGSMNPSIERYFREFGGTLTPYFCVQKVSPVLSTLLKFKKV